MDSHAGFVLLDFLKKALAGWKRLVILMIVGGLVGKRLILGLLEPPIGKPDFLKIR